MAFGRDKKNKIGGIGSTVDVNGVAHPKGLPKEKQVAAELESSHYREKAAIAATAIHQFGDGGPSTGGGGSSSMIPSTFMDLHSRLSTNRDDVVDDMREIRLADQAFKNVAAQVYTYVPPEPGDLRDEMYRTMNEDIESLAAAYEAFSGDPFEAESYYNLKSHVAYQVETFLANEATAAHLREAEEASR